MKILVETPVPTRDLSKYQDLPFSNILSEFNDKLKSYLKDDVITRQGTNYIEFEINPTSKNHRIAMIRFMQDGDIVVYPNVSKRVSPKRLAYVNPPIEDLTDSKIDYLVDRVINTKYFPRMFLK